MTGQTGINQEAIARDLGALLAQRDALLTEVEQLRSENGKLTAAITAARSAVAEAPPFTRDAVDRLLAAALDRPSPEQETAR